MFRLLKDKNGEQLNISIGGRATAPTNFSNRWHHVGVVLNPPPTIGKTLERKATPHLSLEDPYPMGIRATKSFYQVGLLYQTPQRPTYNAAWLPQISLVLAASCSQIRDFRFSAVYFTATSPFSEHRQSTTFWAWIYLYDFLIG